MLQKAVHTPSDFVAFFVRAAVAFIPPESSSASLAFDYRKRPVRFGTHTLVARAGKFMGLPATLEMPTGPD